MPNIKSSKKRAIQTTKKSLRNQARRSSVKTAVKKVVIALELNEGDNAKALLVAAESKIAAAKGKGLMHRKTAARKISRLAKKVAAATRTA
jgi:small subunit ribosomal protein S20